MLGLSVLVDLSSPTEVELEARIFGTRQLQRCSSGWRMLACTGGPFDEGRLHAKIPNTMCGLLSNSFLVGAFCRDFYARHPFLRNDEIS